MIDTDYNMINRELIMFCVYHKNYHKRQDNHYFTFYGVNEIYEKKKTTNNVLEYQLERYNPFLQKRGYMETSAYLHIYWNKLHQGKKMVGISQYDMKHTSTYDKLDNNTLYILIQNNNGRIVENRQWQQNMFPDKRNLDFLIKSYNKHFNMTHSMSDLENMPLGLWQTGIYPVKIFEKLCGWLEILVDDVYPWSVQAPYEQHWGAMSGFLERAISIFNAYEIFNGTTYKGLNIIHDIGAEVKEHYGESFLNNYNIDIQCLLKTREHLETGLIKKFKFYLYDIEYQSPYEKEIFDFFKNRPERTNESSDANIFITCFSDETTYLANIQTNSLCDVKETDVHNKIRDLEFFNLGKHVTFFNKPSNNIDFSNLVNIPFQKRNFDKHRDFILIAPSLAINTFSKETKAYLLSFIVDDCYNQQEFIQLVTNTKESIVVQHNVSTNVLANIIADSMFSLIDCERCGWIYKLTEVVNRGSIPILVTNEDTRNLPGSPYLSYNEFALVVPKFNLKLINLILTNMSKEEMNRKQKALRKANQKYFSCRVTQLSLLIHYLKNRYSCIQSDNESKVSIIREFSKGTTGIVREYKNQKTKFYNIDNFGNKSKELMVICDESMDYTKKYNILHENMEDFTFFMDTDNKSDTISLYVIPNDEIISFDEKKPCKTEIACFSYSNNKAVFDISFPIMDAYCKNHEYQFLPFYENLEMVYKPHWNKLHYILHMIKTNTSKYIVWLDHDIIIKNFDIDMSDIIDEHMFETNNAIFMMSKDPASNYPFNTGVIVMKNNNRLREIIELFIHMRDNSTEYPILNKYGGYDFHNNSIQDTRVMLAYFEEHSHQLLSLPHRVLQSFWGQAWHYNRGDLCGHIAGPQGSDLVTKLRVFKHRDEFDIVIPVGPNDINVVSLQVQYTKKNIIGYRNIYLVSHDPDIYVKGCITIDERDFPFSIFDVARYHGKHPRNGWYLQQMLKFYCTLVIPDILDRYLVIDTDTFFLKPTTFVENNKCLYNYEISSDEFPAHGPYFDHMKKMDNQWKRVNNRKSGICHHMLFEKKYVNEIIDHIESLHNDSFWNVFFKMVDEKDVFDSGASEYEIYFNYMCRYHPEKIQLRLLDWCNTSELNLRRQDKTYLSYHWYRR
jgi:hypothetical protein